MGQQSTLSGYGCGLPLARLYAQYFGGHIDLKSMEGGSPKNNRLLDQTSQFFFNSVIFFFFKYY